MDNIAALILATLLLVLIPGPNVAVIVARSLQHGVRAGCFVTFGTTAGVAVQLLMVSGGIAAVVEAAASTLMILKWAGVAYLIGLGIATWRKPPTELPLAVRRPAQQAFGHGLMVAVLNPKTLLFNAAFLPQFVNAQSAVASQLFILSTIYLTVLLLGDLLWALFAASARTWLLRYGRIRNRFSGCLYAGAGIGLALTRRGC